MNELYYIQNALYCGNAMLWWANNMTGFVTDIRQAGRYTEVEAKRICIGSDTVAWTCEYIDNLLEAQKLIVDHQYTKKENIKTWHK